MLNKGWSEAQIETWYGEIIAGGKKRDYGDVLARIDHLSPAICETQIYGVMSDGNPAFRIVTGDTSNGKPNILITGGIHGYEPSGVEANLRFLEKDAPNLSDKFNFVVYPCISPWAYEYDQRWNAEAQDPNRLFAQSEKIADIEECRHFMTSMESHGLTFACAIDLHETSDRDIELRQLRSARFGTPLAPDFRDIPQGYYLTLSKREAAGDNGRQLLFGQAIIDRVATFSPIAPEKTILEGKVNYGGVILSPPSEGLMRTYLDRHAGLVAVTEIYPDHEKMSPELCVLAQQASIYGALDYVSRLG